MHEGFAKLYKSCNREQDCFLVSTGIDLAVFSWLLKPNLFVLLHAEP